MNESRKFNVKNIKFNIGANYNDNISDSESDKDNMTNLKDNNDGFIKPPQKKIARVQIQHSSTTSTQNKYGILDNEEVSTMETDNQSPSTSANNIPKKQWIPPIIVYSQIVNYKVFNSQIQTILGHGNFRIFYRNTGTKVITQSMQDRAKIMQDFDTSKISFHTFTPNEEKTKKIVMKGAPEMDLSEIKNNLKNQGTDVQDIIKLKTKRQNESFSYLITVKKQQSLQELRKVKNIDQCGVSWERYNKKNTYTQCHNCQEFGHAETNCHKKARCVKCPQFHHWKQCQMQRTETSKPYCHNCGGDHAASFKNCPVLLDYLQKRNEIALARTGQKNPIRQPIQPPTDRIQATPGPSRPNQGTFSNNNTNNRSYSDVLKNKYNEDINISDNSTSNNDELSELIGLINIIKNIKNELRHCSNQFEKMSVIIKYLDKF